MTINPDSLLAFVNSQQDYAAIVARVRAELPALVEQCKKLEKLESAHRKLESQLEQTGVQLNTMKSLLYRARRR